MSASFKLLLLVFFFLPLVQAQSPAPTRSTAGSAAPATTAASDTPPPDSSAPLVSPSPPTQSPIEKTPAPEAKLGFEEAFNLGIKSYQEKKYDVALQGFQRALDLHPESVSVLVNLGLTAFQLHQRGLAIAFFRRALFIEPGNSTAEAALKYSLSQLEVKEIPHQIETYERFRDDFLNIFSLNSLHLLTALLFFASGYIWLRYLGSRRRAFEEESALPKIPVAGSLLALLFVIAIGSTTLKSYDLTVPRATVIVDKVGAQTAPGEGQNTLFDLYAGFEVILRNFSKEWVQVSYPGGLTGWVKKDSLMATSGKSAL